MKLIIAGGRDYSLTPADIVRLNSIGNVTEVVSGGATGVDAAGERWGRSKHLPIQRFNAAWHIHGLRAGPLRNAQMAQYADAVALFPGGRGTLSMFNEATKAGIKIYDFRTPT